MKNETINIPDIGGDNAVVIEVCVKPGDYVKVEDSLIVLESDKATMEIPAPKSGIISHISVKVGDKVSENDTILELTLDSSYEKTTKDKTSSQSCSPSQQNPESEDATLLTDQKTSKSASIKTINTPDIGSENVPIIEICVKEGDSIKAEDPLIVLESDKASMEIPAPESGIVKKIYISAGEKINSGDKIIDLELSNQTEKVTDLDIPAVPTQSIDTESSLSSIEEKPKNTSINPTEEYNNYSENKVHAGPAVRKLARELGVNLTHITGTGPKQRILKEDLHTHVKSKMSEHTTSPNSAIRNIRLPDFNQWGQTETVTLNRLRQIAAENFQASWTTVPHVTQFNDADITDLEAFRIQHKPEAEKRGIKLTVLPFVLKACAYLLKTMPQFCSSLDVHRHLLIYKKYVHIGVAVDTQEGLLVPVIKNVDTKGIWELAAECQELAKKARNKKLTPAEMQGGCFTISSLGSIGGTQFTPIINTPEVAILGLSKAAIKPLWDGNAFQPKLLMPLALSYDHRAINGAEGANFLVTLSNILNDIRNLLL